MEIAITKSARQYGYVIWNKRTEKEIEELFQNKDQISVKLNGFALGEKHIDRKHHRLSLGYKFTRALSEEHTMFSLALKKGILEVTTF